MKTQAHYTAIFLVMEDFGPFTPPTIHCDFESAVHKAVRVHSVRPQTNVKGYYFHSNQALFHNLQTSGFATEYNDSESPIRRYFNLIECLPFVPAQSVQEIWSYLRVTMNGAVSLSSPCRYIARVTDHIATVTEVSL